MTQFTLQRIPEIEHGQPKFKIINLTTIERKISNAFYHKRHRGFCNNKVKYCTTMRQQINLLGLQQCETIDRKDSLMHFKSISPLPVVGIKKGDTAVYVTGSGYLPLTSKEGGTTLIKCMWSTSTKCTFISTSSIIYQYMEIYTSWTLHSNTHQSQGYLQLLHKDGFNHTIFPTYMEWGLWYHYAMEGTPVINPNVRQLIPHVEYKLWYHCLGHPNSTFLCNIHKYTRGIPKKKQPTFYRYPYGSIAIKKDTINPTKRHRSKSNQTEERIQPGQYLHMGFGFVRGSVYKARTTRED